MLSPVICVFLVLLSFFLATSNGNFFDDLFNPGLGKTPKFQGSQLYRLTDANSVRLDGIPGYIGCFGDFNSDKYSDVFLVVGNETETTVNIYLWHVDDWKFQNSSIVVAYPYITSVAAGDFNYDGKLDLMISAKNFTTNSTYVRIHFGDHDTVSVNPDVSIDDIVDQVSIIDANNDLKLDLFGEVYATIPATPTDAPTPPPDTPTGSPTVTPTNNSTSAPTVSPNLNSNSSIRAKKRVFWINKDGAFTMLDDPYTSPLVYPHSSAFVDLDGDCLADRFVVSEDNDGNPQYELLLNTKTKGFTPASFSPVKLPQGSGQISFADFDKDGNLDFIIPVCWPLSDCSQTNSIKVIFNQQKSICSLLSQSSSCRSATNLCSADSKFKLGSLDDPNDSNFVEVNLTTSNGDRFYFDNDNGRPLTLRVGDYNLDGYPDLLIPIIDNSNVSRVELWQSVASSNGKRSFQKLTQTQGVSDLLGIQNAYAGAFFDLGEDGVPDMFVLADNPPRIETVFNNFENDAFFLKTIGLNGVCTEWCPSAPKFPSPKPYGVNFAGAVFKFSYTDLSGSVQVTTATQLPQSAHLPLITPYTLFGLGRMSNYIEQFYYGVPLNQSTHWALWTGSTIPNSQLMAVPYKPESPAGWTLELYITPSGLLFWIMVGLVGSVIILAFVVFLFYRQEKKEDEQKKQEQAHLFSFDAL